MSFKEILKDIFNILKISLLMLFFSFLNVCFKIGEFNFSILQSLYKVTIDYFIPYYLPALIFFYFLKKNF